MILIVSLLAAAFLYLLGVQLFSSEKGTQVEITIDGEAYGTYDLNQNQTIPIKKNGKVTNILTIKDGVAKMTEADCPDKLCIHQKEISAAGETIVCLPNKIVVTVIGSESSEFDSVAN
ncbi:MAG: NusG domain II-containing protein [Lachnospiraceae bacterium]